MPERFFLSTLRGLWDVVGEMSPYLLFGFLVAGILSVVFKRETIERHLGGNSFGSVVKAALFGIPLPLCSCGVIPVAASLRRNGAGKGASLSFLLSTPQTGVDSIAVTYSLLGPLFALFRPLAALLSGLLGGFAAIFFDREETSAELATADSAAMSTCGDGCCGRDDSASTASRNDECFDPADSTAAATCSDGCSEPAASGAAAPGKTRGSVARALEYGFLTLPGDIGKPLLAGLLAAGLISAAIPADFFAGSLGTGFPAMIMMMLLGLPVYVCATASVPIAAALILKGVSPGAALVFLMTGPATNIAAVTTIWIVMGRRTTIIYLATVVVSALVSGMTLDYIFRIDGMAPSPGTHSMLPGWIETVSAIALFAIVGAALIRPKFAGKRKTTSLQTEKPEGAEPMTFKIEGMTCSHCAASVKRALEGCDGVTSADVDQGRDTAIVDGESYDSDTLRAAVESLGYKVSEIIE